MDGWKFRLGPRLGQGGGGEVFKAHDRELNRTVALKFLKGGDPEEIARFKREAQVAGSLDHPNIAAIYEVGEHDGRHFIAMQYIEGRTLRGWTGTSEDAARLIRDAARAVAAAHERGIVHRDLKPENLMLAGDRLYVMDFGLARSVEGASSISASGDIMGTPAYMSPEQARGERVTDRTDVYSLGATLYELLAGRPPISGASLLDTLRRIQEDDPTPMPGIDGDLAGIVFKCLEKDPARRYSASTLADDLDRRLRGEAVSARTAGTMARIGRSVAKRRTIAAVVAIAVVTLAAAGVLLRGSTSKAEETREAALANLRRNADTSLRSVFELRRTGRFDAMEVQGAAFMELAQRIVKEQPDLAEPHYLIGRFRRAQFDLKGALVAQEEALERDPAFAPALYESLYLNLFRLMRLTRLKVSEVREPASNSLLQTDPVLREICDLVRSRAARIPAESLAPGRRECVQAFVALVSLDASCIDLLKRALAIDPDIDEAREMSLYLLNAKGRHEEAVALSTEGVQRDAGSLFFREERAIAHEFMAKRAVMRGEDPAPHIKACLADLDFTIAAKPDATRHIVRADALVSLGDATPGPDGIACYERALRDLDEAEKTSNDGEIFRIRGRARLNWSERSAGPDALALLRAADEDLGRALRLDPSDARSLGLRGVVRGLLAIAARDPGLLAKAEEDLQAATRVAPDDPEPVMQAANLRINWNAKVFSKSGEAADLDGILAQLSAILAREAPPPAAWLYRGNAYTQRGGLKSLRGQPADDDLKAAIRDYDAFLRTKPSDRVGRLSRAKALAELAHATRGEPGSELFAEAVAAFSTLLDAYPDDADILRSRGDARLNWANNRYAAKLDSAPLLRQAIEDYSAVIRLNPLATQSWFGRGLAKHAIAVRTGNDALDDEAAKDYTQALEIEPQLLVCLFELGRLHERRAAAASKAGRNPIRHAEAAIPPLERAVALAPKHATAWRLLGICRMFRVQVHGSAGRDVTQDLKATIQAFEAALELNPGFEDVRANLETCRRLLKQD